MQDYFGNPIVEWPKHYKPLPEGYQVVLVDECYFMWVNEKLDQEGYISWDRYWVRRCAFAHHEKMMKLDKE